MSLLQDPIKTIDQIEWFLDSSDLEKFPGAYMTSAGNLCRQLVEQIQFILAFYSGMPRNKYMRADGSLKTLKIVWDALHQVDPISNKTYFELARRKGSRIRKFARHPRSLNKWRDQFNEPSHFRNPAANRNTKEGHMWEFVAKMRSLFDEKDSLLVLCAMNELRTGGKVKVLLNNDSDNTPMVSVDVVIRPSNLHRDANGNLTLSSPQGKIRVLPDDEEIPHRWSSGLALVRAKSFNLQGRLINENGKPINLTNFETILESLMDTTEAKQKVIRRLRRLGFTVEFH